MTNLSLLAGMSSDELSKSLIRGLPDDLKWQVVAFNPKTMEDTVERILLAESSYQWKTKEHCNTIEERLVTQRTNDVLEKLTQKIAELESSLEGCKKTLYEQNRTDDTNPQKAVQLTVDAGTVEKTTMQKSIVTPETTVRTQPTTEEATMRTDSRTDVEDSKVDSKTPSTIQKTSRAHGDSEITTGRALQDEHYPGEWLAQGFSI